MKSRHFLAAALAAATFMTAAPLASQANDIRIGAMREGSSWYVFAATLEKMLEPNLSGQGVEVIARGGGVSNPMVVQNGDAEIALSNVATSVWARNGHDMYGGSKAPDIRALVGGLNSVYVGVMIREPFIEKMGTADLEEILGSGKPIRLVLKPTGSSAVPAAEMILSAFGSSFDKIKADGGDVIQVETAQISSMLADGSADVYIDTVIRGHPAITEVSLTGNVRFIDVPEKALKVLAENGLNPSQYGPDWFKGQTGETWGADLGTVLVANASLSDDVAYQITKTLVENAAAMGEAHAAWKTFKPENAWKPELTGVPLHPGAERYYRERGWM